MVQHRIDPDSPTWLAVKAFIEDRMKAHSRTALSPGMDMSTTEQARGAARDLNMLLGLPDAQRKADNVPSPNVAEYGVNLV